MIKIKYFDGKKTIEVEVDEKTAEGYKQILRNEWRLDKQMQRHQTKYSLDQIENENGYQLEDLSVPDMFTQAIDAEDNEKKHNELRCGLKSLTKEDRKLIIDVIVKERPLKEIAADMGITYQSVQDRRRVILKKLRKFFSK